MPNQLWKSLIAMVQEGPARPPSASHAIVEPAPDDTDVEPQSEPAGPAAVVAAAPVADPFTP